MRSATLVGNAGARKCVERYRSRSGSFETEGNPMNGIIYIIGLVVVVVAVLSFFGLR
ncbi:hypothetical protein [Prosthecomicrobium sp. N25]|uniref:hypothetical protein n=1 Tax=Prosthecomicrobium sp. N25 TaxID=3129254 RepID=UPI00307868EA